MPPNPDDILRWLTMASVFGLVLSLWMMGVIVWRARRAMREELIRRRLELMAQPSGDASRILRLWTDEREATMVVPGAPGSAGVMSQLEYMRRVAGIRAPLWLSIGAVAGMALLAGLLIEALLLNWLVAGCGALAVLLVAWVWLRQRILKRAVLFESQLVDALDLAARSLRAGHPLQGAFRLIASEIAAPVGAAFADICQVQELGIGLDEALRRAAVDSLSPDLKLFATSVAIQMRTGGNLADMMERLAMVIRDRMRLSRRVRVLTAQTQLSKNILLLLPVVVFLVLNLINPRYMTPLYSSPQGQRMVTFAACSMLLGTWVMNRLATIRY